MTSQVIDLTDDKDEIEVIGTTRGTTKKRIKCLNPECRSEVDLLRASDSVKRFYGVESYRKKRRICSQCLKTFFCEKNHNINLIKSGKNIFSKEITWSRKTLIVHESDSEDSSWEGSSDESECEFDLLQMKRATKENDGDSSNFIGTLRSTLVKDDDIEELQNVALEIINEQNLLKQMAEGGQLIQRRLERAQASFDGDICNEFSLLDKELNQVRNDFYATFQEDVEYAPSIEIGPPECFSQQNGEINTPNYSLRNNNTNTQSLSSTRLNQGSVEVIEDSSSLYKSTLSKNSQHEFQHPNALYNKSSLYRRSAPHSNREVNGSSPIITLPKSFDSIPPHPNTGLQQSSPRKKTQSDILNYNPPLFSQQSNPPKSDLVDTSFSPQIVSLSENPSNTHLSQNVFERQISPSNITRSVIPKSSNFRDQNPTFSNSLLNSSQQKATLKETSDHTPLSRKHIYLQQINSLTNLNIQNKLFMPNLRPQEKSSCMPLTSDTSPPDTSDDSPLEDVDPRKGPNSESSGVVIVKSTSSTPSQIPPPGPLIRAQIRKGDKLYMMRSSKLSKWIEGTVVKIELQSNSSEFMFDILYMKENSDETLIKTVSAKHLAYDYPCQVRVPVGTRIIALVDDYYSKCFYVGVVAELPTAANKYRYLVFFDDGYSQYVNHSDIRVVAQDNLKVWEDVEKRSQDFIMNYLETYPEKPMVRLHKYGFIQTELDGRWFRAQVTELDCSLAKIFFPVQSKCEWIYRGSTRFQPLFERKLKFNAKMKSETPNLTIRRRTLPLRKKNTVVEFVNLEEQCIGTSNEIATSLDNVDKNTSLEKENRLSVSRQLVREKKGSKIQFDSNVRLNGIKKFSSHECNQECLVVGGERQVSKKDSPLFKPILLGWRRQLTKEFKKTLTRMICMYVTPCGLRLRSYEEICKYLKLTNSSLSIDMFTLDKSINLFRTWEPEEKKYFLSDITEDKEDVHISCVNSIDGFAPKKLLYSSERVLSTDVRLTLDSEYLVCCKCEDDCMNKMECECWQLTIDCAMNLSNSNNIDINMGYNYKRLYEQIVSGIFECNPKCSCKSSCLNRVVQYPIKQKLQLFKTALRGWGVRTLNDIPKGTFICVYGGKVISEAEANQNGIVDGGDEYYANLDYIEVVEGLKEGYESDVTDIEDESDISNQDSESYEQASDSEEEKSRKRRKSRYEKDDDFKLPAHLRVMATRERSARINRPKTPENENSNDSSDFSKRAQKNFEPDNVAESQLFPKLQIKSLREFYKKEEAEFVMDAKIMGNIGRYFNHSCSPNIFCQNVFVDTHDPRFPWISFFTSDNIVAGTELTWDYNYEIGSIPNRYKKCYCASRNCKGRFL